MGRRPGPSSLASLSVGALEAELRRRARSVGKLQKKRQKLLNKLATLDRQISLAGGRVRGGGGARARNGVTLPQALAKVLSGKTLGVTEAAEAVRRSGYQTHAANFRTMVNAALLKHKKLFKKVARGQYTRA